MVIDGAARDPKQDHDLIEKARQQGRFLIVANKCDLADFNRGDQEICVSALTGKGFDRLREAIFDTLAPRGELEMQGGFITSVRQENLLREALPMLQRARSAAQDGIAHELLMLDLYCALHPIDAITGATSADDILTKIFTSFCIGK